MIESQSIDVDGIFAFLAMPHRVQPIHIQVY